MAISSDEIFFFGLATFSSEVTTFGSELATFSSKVATFELEIAFFASVLASFSSSGDKTCDKAGDKLGTLPQLYRHYLLYSLGIIPIHDGSKESSETTAIGSGTHSHKFLDKPSGKAECRNSHTIGFKRVFFFFSYIKSQK